MKDLRVEGFACGKWGGKPLEIEAIEENLNGDGQVELSVIDTSIDGLEILEFDRETGLKEATHFRVFEEKRLVSTDADRGTEPREGIVADVTSDGWMDLILLCMID